MATAKQYDGNLLADFLTELCVRHTSKATEMAMRNMNFRSLFGLGKLLQSYGVDTQGLEVADRGELSLLTPPFLASTPGGIVIVTGVGKERVDYLTQGVAESMDMAEFDKVWDGRVLLGFPHEDACEPDYTEHHIEDVAAKVKRGLLPLLLVALFGYLVAESGVWRHLSTILIVLLDLAGLWLTYMLVQKSLKISNPAADRVCGVLQAGGCDSVLEMKASKFFGIFGWSEVGFAYFSVSLLALLMFPQSVGWLAVCNLCCLPFTAWSIWYQKFRAKVWCTLCVSVQCTLWLLFFCYLGGGWIELGWPLGIGFFVLGATYVTVLLILNRILPKFEKDEQE